MSRLIDADQLKKQAYKSGDWDKPLVVDVDDIDDAPTVDQWHYPSKGEYPTETDEYLVLLRQDDKICPSIGEYYAEAKTWYSVNWRGESDDTPIAWKYIIPPKENL